MKTLLKKGMVLVALVVATALGIFLLPIPYSHDLAAIQNKVNLVKDERQNRIIFVGGSGLYDGLDSERIQYSLDRPVVNIGLYAGFGVTALLQEIKSYLRPGDAVVIVPEYGVVFDSYDDQSRKWIFAMAPSRNLLPLYRSAQNGAQAFGVDFVALVRAKVQGVPKAAREVIRTRRFSPFFREGYVYFSKYCNEYGDSLRSFRTASSPDMIEQRGLDLFSDPLYRDQSLESLNDFCQEAGQGGVQTYFLFPAYPLDEYDRQRDGMRRFQQRLQKELKCPILGTPEDFLYPYGFFTNTVNHLSSEGKRKRTDKVISLLKKSQTLSQKAQIAIDRRH